MIGFSLWYCLKLVAHQLIFHQLFFCFCFRYYAEVILFPIFLIVTFLLFTFTSCSAIFSLQFFGLIVNWDIFEELGPFYKLCQAELNLLIFAKVRLCTAYKMEFELSQAKPCSTPEVVVPHGSPQLNTDGALFIKPNVEPSRAWTFAFYNPFLSKLFFCM